MADIALHGRTHGLAERGPAARPTTWLWQQWTPPVLMVHGTVDGSMRLRPLLRHASRGRRGSQDDTVTS